MGLDIDRVDFNEADYSQFRGILGDNLEALKRLLSRPQFGEGEGSIGAEIELYIVDQTGNPLSINTELIDDTADPQLTVELNRYNLEYNLSPQRITQHAFIATEQEILAKLNRLNHYAKARGGRVVPIGILPTLCQHHVGCDFMTNRRRYHALLKQLVNLRGGSFQIDINGRNPLQLNMDDVTLEGATTSFQVHYKVSPKKFSDTYNAIQLATPVALAIAGNSPLVFGHSLWEETRIPLFKQSIDIRIADRYGWQEPPRVGFGNGWLHGGADVLFAEAVRQYRSILPIVGDQDALAIVAEGGLPRLEELKLHLGTIWSWNRPVYDDADGGHLRIEMRALPAGPSAVDMVANAAFMIGLAEGLKPAINDRITALPFHLAEYNLYRACQFGLNARLVWPHLEQASCTDQPVKNIIEQCLPVALGGLKSIGVDQQEAEYYLGIIQRRLLSGQTGASWQRASLYALTRKMPQTDALHAMLETYMQYSSANKPVAEWEVAS